MSDKTERRIDMPRPRKLTPIEEQAVYQMKKQGVPTTEIAYKNGISTRTVDRIVKRIEKGEKDNGK